MMIEMLRRSEGATTEAIVEVTGWQRHTIRGPISTLRSKKGFPIEATVIKNVGPSAKGGTTRYKLAAPG